MPSTVLPFLEHRLKTPPSISGQFFRFLMPGLLGAREELEKCLVEDSPKNLQLLRRQVTPFVLRRMKNRLLRASTETELPCP